MFRVKSCKYSGALLLKKDEKLLTFYFFSFLSEFPTLFLNTKNIETDVGSHVTIRAAVNLTCSTLFESVIE